MRPPDSVSSSAAASRAASLVEQGLHLHRTGKVNAAADLYAEAIRCHPDHAEAHHLLGVARLAQQRLNDALPLLATALELQPDNPQYLANLGVALNAAESYERALAVLDRSIALKPDSAEAYSNRGMACRGLGQFEEAVASYEEAIRLKPEEAGFHFNLANALAGASRPHEALQAVERALALRPRHQGATASRIRILQTLRRYDDALAAAEEAERRMPESTDVLGSLASILARTGNMARSMTIQRRILVIDASNGPALHGLARARRHTGRDAELQALARVFRDPAVPRRNRAMAGFGYGKALADIGEHGMSHDTFVEANAMRRLDQPYSLSRALATIQSIATQFETTQPSPAASEPVERAAPIFVVGLPRAGKTTIEMLLASVPGTWAAGELNQLKRSILDVLPASDQRERDPFVRLDLSRLDSVALRAAGSRYLRYIESLAPPGTVGIDTMPPNFMLVGFLRAMLPNARIVHAVRDPLEHRVELFEKHFSRSAYGYTYALRELQAYYTAYRSMMALWDRLYPGAIFHADVAELQSRPGRVRELLEFCGLASAAATHAIAESEPELGSLPLQARATARARHAAFYADELAGLAASPPATASGAGAGNRAFTDLNGR